MIQGIEHVGPNLHPNAFVDWYIFRNAQIQIPQTRPPKRAAARVSGSDRCTGCRCARYHLKSIRIEILESFSIVWQYHLSSDVIRTITRPRRSLCGGLRQARIRPKDSRSLPATQDVAKGFRDAIKTRQLVHPARAEEMRDIKRRRSSICSQIEVFLIQGVAVLTGEPSAEIPCRIGNTFRPCVIHIEAQVPREPLRQRRLPRPVSQALGIVRVDGLRQIRVGSKPGDTVNAVCGTKQNQLNAASSRDASAQHQSRSDLPLNIEAELHGIRHLQLRIEHLENVGPLRFFRLL